MSDELNKQEETQEEGVTKMSLSDALDLAQGVEKDPEVIEEIEEETVVEAEADEEVKAEVEAEAEAEVEEEKEAIETSETPKETYDDLYDDEDKAYFAFKKSNKGSTRADYNESKVDYDKLDRKDLLRKSLREKYNLSDDDAEIDDYIETEHGIPMDADESEMSLTERVRLRKLTDGYVNDKKEQQQKWSDNTVNDTVAKNGEVEMLTLEDGSTIEKAKYEKIVENRNNYIKNNEEAVNRVTATSFKLKVDDNGSVREIEYSYPFDKSDKHRMLSNTNDVAGNFTEKYTTKEGYNHEGINIDQAWADRQIRDKMLQSMAQTIRAEAIEEVMSEKGNVSIGSQKRLNRQETNGMKIVSLSEAFNH